MPRLRARIRTQVDRNTVKYYNLWKKITELYKIEHKPNEFKHEKSKQV